MHFFMPIKGRDLVEIVSAPSTDSRTIDRVVRLANQIGKQALIVNDSPALVVNRMLTPFLNQGLLLLERGADHRDIRQAASRFGMPFSPLEMIDMIGARTAFDAGRVAWQAFSDRIETTPIIPGLVKSGLLGRAVGEGFYEYDPIDGRLINPDRLNPKAESVIKKYQRAISTWDVETIELHLAIPMMIEAEFILRDSIVSGRDKIELSMREGLGYRSKDGFYQYFEKLGAAKITSHRERFGAEWKALR
jgi:3-hydroxyacyl-CoA dehydrogenase